MVKFLKVPVSLILFCYITGETTDTYGADVLNDSWDLISGSISMKDSKGLFTSRKEDPCKQIPSGRSLALRSGAANENIVQNPLNIALLNAF